MAELELRLGCTSQTIYEKANAAAPGTFIPLVKEGRRTGALNSEVEAYLAGLPRAELGPIEHLNAGRAAQRRRAKNADCKTDGETPDRERRHPGGDAIGDGDLASSDPGSQRLRQHLIIGASTCRAPVKPLIF